MSQKDGLGEFEQLVLLALVHLKHNAYGMTIRREINQRTGRDVSIGAVYTTLDRLENKGYISSFESEATAERGNRARRYFKLEGLGATALQNSLHRIDAMRLGLPVTSW
jgi:PadR family transcriptional regulator, regulatory protein PadR